MQLRMRPASVLTYGCYHEVARIVTDQLEEVTLEELFHTAQPCGSEDPQGSEAPSPVVEEGPIDNVGQASVSSDSVGLPNEGDGGTGDTTLPETSDTHDVLEPVAYDASQSSEVAGSIPLIAIEVY